MKKIIFLVLLSSFLFGSCKDVGSVTGKVYNSYGRRWITQTLDIYTCTDKNGIDRPYYAQLIGSPNIRVSLSNSERLEIIKKLETAKKWSRKAKKEKVASFSKKLFKSKHSIDGMNFLSIDFFTANKGKQNNIIVDITDFSNMYEKGETYIDESNLHKFMKILEQAELTLAEVKKADDAASKFQ